MAAGKTAVVAAVIGNGVLTAIKFAAFAVSGSGAMFSEAMHSLADTANQTLLFVGIRSSERPADAMFPYGYGRDRYFFSLMSAVGVFLLGCGVTIYHGVHTLLHPPVIGDITLSMVVLSIAFVVDGAVLSIALRAVLKTKGEKSLRQFLRETSDPTIPAVLLEDSVACIGVLVAMAAIGLTKYTGNPIFDSLGTLAIGGMLGGLAIWLGFKNRTLLLGPAVQGPVNEGAATFLRGLPQVKKLHSSRTRILGADRFGLTADIDFDGAYLGGKQAGFVAAHADKLKSAEQQQAFAEAFGERLVDDLADEVDEIERKLIEKFPKLRYVDLEAD